MRFKNGDVQKMAGSSELITTSVAPYYSVRVNAIASGSSSATSYYVYCGAAAIYCFNQGSTTNMTRSSGAIRVLIGNILF